MADFVIGEDGMNTDFRFDELAGDDSPFCAEQAERSAEYVADGNRPPAIVFAVIVKDDHVMVSGVGQLATFEWKPNWGSSVKRLTTRVTTYRKGDISYDRYAVVAAADSERHQAGGVLAEVESLEGAHTLIAHIENSIKASLGITSKADIIDVTQVLDEESPVAARKNGLLASSVAVAATVSKIFGVVMLVVATLSALAFAVPVAYQYGEHVLAKQLPAGLETRPGIGPLSVESAQPILANYAVEVLQQFELPVAIRGGIHVPLRRSWSG
jgi:hypothetical protein